jgi:GAF domain-containing protein
MVGELGAEFGNLHAADVDRRIEDALSRLIRVLGLDRSALFQVERETGDFVYTHQWTRPGWAPPPPRVSARERFPWILARIREGELVRFSTLDEIPEPTDRDSFRQLATKSSVIVPLMIGGELWGALTFAALREPRVWSAAEINRFRVVALIFANALARKAADERQHAALFEIAASATGCATRTRTSAMK